MTWAASRPELLPAAPPGVRRDVIAVAGVGVLSALAFGLLLPVEPAAALAAIVAIPLTFAAPLASLSVLLAVTVLVPFDVQDEFAVIGGVDKPGLLLVDVLLLLGLCRVGWLILRRRLKLSVPLLGGVLVALIVTAALVWGLRQGASASEAGHEARRVALGIGAFLLAWPLVNDPVARRKLGPVLIGLGLALGVWGLAQWIFLVGYTVGGDVGIRPGVDLTSSGLGQLQGGLYAFPVAVTLAWAALVSGRVRSVPTRYLLAVVLVLNTVCLLLTFERTFWAATVLACLVVAFRSGAAARRLALKLAAAGAALLVVLAVLAPGVVRTAAERLVSVGDFQTDTSVESRVVESQAAVDAIAGRPLTGSGLGAMITWGKQDVFGTTTTPFVHNGYLWLTWKIGIPAAALIVLLIAGAVIRRRPTVEDDQWRSLRIGSQAAVLALLLTSVFFPAFNALGITAVLGLLVAVSYSPGGAGLATPLRGGRGA